MKTKLKASVAAAILAISGSAQADILTGVDAELFLSIFHQKAGQEVSMILDTGIRIEDVQAGTVTSWTSTAAQTAAISNFIAGRNISDLVFNGGGVQPSTTTYPDFGYALTSTTPIDLAALPTGNSGFTNINTNMNQQIVSANNFGFNADDYITGLVAGDGGYHDDLFLWSDNIGGQVGMSTEGRIDQTLEMSFVTFDTSAVFQPVISSLGFFNIDTATGAASFSTGISAVPVPAAVWLFGSGLMGLVGVARRRSV